MARGLIPGLNIAASTVSRVKAKPRPKAPAKKPPARKSALSDVAGKVVTGTAHAKVGTSPKTTANIAGKSLFSPDERAKLRKAYPNGVPKDATVHDINRATGRKSADPLAALDVSALPIAVVNKATGAHLPSLGHAAEVAGAAAVNTVGALATHPKALLKTITSIPLVAEGAAAAGVELFTHPRQFFKQLPKTAAADFTRRYGDVLDDPAAFRKRVEKEGALPEILDAAGIAAPALKAGGELGTRVAASGAVGKAAKDFVEAPRPNLRVAAGERGAVTQEKSSNIARLALQRVKDRQRETTAQKRLAAAQDTTKPGFRGLVPGEGEVVKKSLRAQGYDQRRGIADLSARTQSRVRRQQDREVRSGINKEVSTLSKAERHSLKYYVQLGLPADTRLALQELKAHRQNIIDTRAEQGTKIGRRDELKQLDQIIAAPEKHLSAKVRQIADLQVQRAKSTAAQDPGVGADAALARQYADQGAHLGVHRAEDETAQAFVNRVKQAAVDQERQHLVEPGYFFSREFERGANSAFAGGQVGRAVAGPKRYTGRLFETGRQDASPKALALGVARNIKRAHNWHGVSDMWARNTPEWGRNRPLLELEKEIDQRHLNPDDWRFIDTGKYRAAQQDLSHTEGVDTSEADLHQAVTGATLDLQGARAAYKNTGARLTIIPKAVSDEIVAGTKPANAGLRTLQKFQGLQSRILLHTNPTFVPVQIASNTPLAIMALKGNVRDLIGGQVWYRGLDQQAKDAVDDYIGISASRAFTHSPRYGAAAEGKLTRFFDAVADNPRVRGFGDSHLNPINWNPWLDDKQNAFFRRAVFYNDAKRLAAKRMGDQIHGIVADARPVIDVLKMAPGAERDAAIRAAEPQFEKIGKRTDELLGNYTSYTAFERQALKTSVLFYGFLRWSVQFTFYTLPIKHPIAAAIAGKLGQLHDEEVISLLSDQAAAQGMGTKKQVADLLRSGAESYVFGRVWLMKNGKLESIDVARVNPLLNPLLQSLHEGPAKAGLGLLSPVAQAATDTAYDKSVFTGQDLKDSAGNKLHGLGEKSAYVLGQFGRTAFPVRVGEKLLHPGSLADNSIPLIADKGADLSGIAAQAREKQKLQRGGGAGEVLLDNLLPLLRGKQDNTLGGIASAIQQQQKAAAKTNKGSGSASPASSVQDKIDAVLRRIQSAHAAQVPSAAQDRIDAVLEKIQAAQAGR